MPLRSVSAYARLRASRASREESELGAWLPALRCYLGVSALGHLLWEILQLPLYTLWTEGTAAEIAFAVLHCTIGDVLIALASLAAALVLAGAPGWPVQRFATIAALTVSFGVTYTVYSEWLHTSVRGSWAYAPSMPTIPPLDTGLTPALQWLAIPLLALGVVRHVQKSRLP